MATANTANTAVSTPEIHIQGLTLIRESKQTGTWIADYIQKKGRFINKIRVLVALENGKVDEHFGLDELPKHQIVDSPTGLGTLVFDFN